MREKRFEKNGLGSLAFDHMSRQSLVLKIDERPKTKDQRPVEKQSQ